jgi:hypothetical protein
MHRCDVLLFLYENNDDSRLFIEECNQKFSNLIPRILINVKKYS